MKLFLLPCFLAGALCASFFDFQDEKATAQEPQMSVDQLKEMLDSGSPVMMPGKHHKKLERFLGKWQTKNYVIMAGRKLGGQEGQIEYSWLIEGRWLLGKMTGTMMGMPMESYSLMGYDNFKKSYVVTMVSSLDTAMSRAEGDMNRQGDAIIAYGTLDEYMTGEHDKMVKYVWRFTGEDRMQMEVYDFPIGEENNQVIEILMKRVGS